MYIVVTLAMFFSTRALLAQNDGAGRSGSGVTVSATTIGNTSATTSTTTAKTATKTTTAAAKASDRITGIDRWSFRVNALELLCTVPNFNVEFDVSSSPYNRWSLGLTAKYNWDTWHSVPPTLVFNMFEIRPEFRKWFRMKPKEGNDKPTRERAFFLGGYASGGTYSIKPGKYGIQGPLFGAGALFGYDFPLYTYRHFAIDFELGVAAGLAVTSYDGYTMNRSNTDYIEAPGKSKGWHLCPFPVLSEIKACFVFRTLSIKEKYKKVDSQKLIQKQEAEEAKRLAAEQKAEKIAEKKAERKAEKKAEKKAERKAKKKAEGKVEGKAEKEKEVAG